MVHCYVKAGRHLLAFGLCVVCAGHAFAEFRVWTGKNGVGLDADLIRQTESSVVLKRRDGQVFTIAKTNLSAADVEYLESLTPAGAAAGAPVDPSRSTASREARLRKGLVFENIEPPAELTLKRVPLVKQVGHYCVPASAEMIAVYHKIRVNQTQIARFSSNDSKNHQGTYPEDMANAMENLGFVYEIKQWTWEPRKQREPIPDQVRNEILPFIYKAIANCGPLYTSFKPGVFGDRGHGCVLIGYDQKKELLRFHNPWGNAFTKTFAEFAAEACEVVAFQMPPQIAGDGRAQAETIAKAVPILPAGLGPMQFVELLKKKNIPAHIQLSARRDQQQQRGSTQSWGVSQGFRIINSALRTNLVVLMPSSDPQGAVKEWILLYRDPEGDRTQLFVRRSAASGWQKEQDAWPSELTSDWAVLIGSGRWDLPLILIGAPPEASGAD